MITNDKRVMKRLIVRCEYSFSPNSMISVENSIQQYMRNKR
jgi:hypothetical protein